MKISKIHKQFADCLNNQEALTYPEKFLGPNYKTVLNFWTYIETLNVEQWNVVRDRYRALKYKELVAAGNAAWIAANDVVGDKFRNAAWIAANDVVGDKFRKAAGYATPGYAAAHATVELISMHTLLDSGKTLKFIPLFDSL